MLTEYPDMQRLKWSSKTSQVVTPTRLALITSWYFSLTGFLSRLTSCKESTTGSTARHGMNRQLSTAEEKL